MRSTASAARAASTPATSPTRSAISTVLIHPLSSLLSAYGMGLADIAAQRAQGVDEPLRSSALLRVGAVADRARRRGGRRGRGAGGRARGDQGPSPRAAALCGLRHDDRGSAVDAGRDAARLRERAQAPLRLHRPAKAIAIEAVSAEAVGGAARLRRAERAAAERQPPPSVPARATRFFSHGRWREANVFLREALPVGADVDGPALIIEPHQTIVVEQGWRARITQKNHVLMTRVEPMPRREAIGAKADPGHARDLQPSLHVDRRADGRDAAEHRLFGQHQGAARLLLRRVRPRGPPRRQRAAHAGASGLDGSLGRDDHPRQ